MKDIVPELLDDIKKDFKRRYGASGAIKRIMSLMEQGKATYAEANDYAIEVGSLLAEVFKTHISPDILPEGRMYFNIADRILHDTLGNNHELISAVTTTIQTDLNKAASLGIKGIAPELNEDRVMGLINRISSEDYENVDWLLDEPVVNFSQSIVDDAIQKNSEFHSKLGLRPKIIRTTTGRCCDWCKQVAGTYEYPAPSDVYRRHQYCKCTVEYNPGDGRRQNAHSKRWLTP